MTDFQARLWKRTSSCSDLTSTATRRLPVKFTLQYELGLRFSWSDLLPVLFQTASHKGVFHCSPSLIFTLPQLASIAALQPAIIPKRLFKTAKVHFALQYEL